MAKWWSICLQCRRLGFSPWEGKIPWRREWPPTPVSWPGEFHEPRSLVSYSPWGHKVVDTTEWLSHNLIIFSFSYSNHHVVSLSRLRVVSQLRDCSVVSDSLWPPWTVAYQAPPSMGFSRQEYWSGLPFPSPEDLPDPGIEPRSSAL